MPKVSSARHLLPLVCSLFIVSVPVLAQTSESADATARTDETDPNIVVLPEFTVSMKTEEGYRSSDAISAVRVRAPLIDTASSLTVITRELIDDIAPNRIFDVTRYVAGVQEGRGIQFQDRMIIRGFETQNGARTVDSFLQSADADNVEESVIDRIEVTKGPNAILSPAGAPGGSINVVTKSPLFQEQRSLSAQVGLFDSQKLTLDLTGPFSAGSDLAYRLVGSFQDSRRYWSADARIRGKALAPMLTWRISDKTMLTVKVVGAEHWIYREPLLILDADVDADTDSPYLADGISTKGRNGIQDWSHVSTHSADLFAVLTTALNDHISLRFAANGRFYYEDDDQEFVGGLPSLSNRYNPYTGELTQDYTWAKDSSGDYVATYSKYFDPTAIPAYGQKQWTTRRTGSIQTDLVGVYEFFGVSSQTVTGLAWSHQEADTRLKQTSAGSILIDLTDPDTYAYPDYSDNLTARNQSSYQNLQLYINQRFGFWDDRIYVTLGALRYQTYTKSWNGLTHSGLSVLDDSKNMFSESVLWKALKNFSLYYSHSTNAAPVIANNKPLWRDGQQDEVGFKSEFLGQRLAFNGAWFRINQTNVTIPNPAHQNDTSEPEQLVSDYGNHGLEFEVMGRLSDTLSATAAYSKLKMRDSLGRRVRGVADDVASMMLNYRFKDGVLKGLTLNGGVTYTGRRAGDVPSINYTALNVVAKVSFYLKPQFGTTLGATYRWNQWLSTRLNVDNIFDETGYIAVAGGRVSGTGLTTATGLNVRLTNTISF